MFLIISFISITNKMLVAYMYESRLFRLFKFEKCNHLIFVLILFVFISYNLLPKALKIINKLIRIL